MRRFHPRVDLQNTKIKQNRTHRNEEPSGAARGAGDGGRVRRAEGSRAEGCAAVPWEQRAVTAALGPARRAAHGAQSSRRAPEMDATPAARVPQ